MSSAGVTLSSIPNEFALLPGYFHTQCSKPDESIMIYVATSGSIFPLRVFRSDSIEAVKLRIQKTCEGGIDVKNQKLVCGGRELARNDSLIREYRVADGNVMHLVVRRSYFQAISLKIRMPCGEELKFDVERDKDVAYVKQQIAKKEKGFVDIEDQEVFCNGERLQDKRLLCDICKDSDIEIHLFWKEKNFELSIDRGNYSEDGAIGCDTDSAEVVVGPRKPPDRDFLLEPIVVNPKIELPKAIKDLIKSTFDGLDSGNHPVISTEGTGGTYFMQDSLGQKYVSVFKPIDEEPMAENNPRDLPLSTNGEGLKRGTRVGQGAFREVAAYLLDHPKAGCRSFSGQERGFAGVPPTFMVKCLHRGFNHPKDVSHKIGSLQMFMDNHGSCEDMGPGAFPLEEVHKISVFDIRMANADRHAGNILVSKYGEDGRTVLIPIDHGYCLPENFEDCTFDWLYWPQARKPYSPATIDYIKFLDAEADIALLKFYGWDVPPKCARTLSISTMLLKKGAERGLTPFAIAKIMCREILNKESVIEEIVQEAKDSVLPGTSEAAFLESVSEIMDRRLNEIA